MQEELVTLPLYYQQAFIYESNKLNRNGGIYGNPQYNYDWDITKWTVEPDASGKMVMNTNTGPVEFFEHPWFNPGLYITNKVLFDRLITCDGGLAPTRPKMAKYYKLSKDAFLQLKERLEYLYKLYLDAGGKLKWSMSCFLKCLLYCFYFTFTIKYIF